MDKSRSERGHQPPAGDSYVSFEKAGDILRLLFYALEHLRHEKRSVANSVRQKQDLIILGLNLTVRQTRRIISIKKNLAEQTRFFRKFRGIISSQLQDTSL